jgi:SET domain-containing protein
MAQLPPHLEVKPSLIEGAGMGLFAKKRIKEGRKIGRYRGTSYRRDACKNGDLLPDFELRRPYLLRNFADILVDGYSLNNHMRWANHSTTPNAWAKAESDGVVYFIALRTIESGEEIYIDYGYDPVLYEQRLKRKKEQQPTD